jgi:transcriptional regulator with PAS, ATPase and Fis domain
MNRNIEGFSKGAQQELMSHHWPGNVRELRNVIERAVILENTKEVQSSNLPDFHLETRLRKSEPAGTQVVTGSLNEIISNYEHDLIANILEQNHFSLTRTADQLQISRHALRYRMQRLNISLGSDEDPNFTTKEASL